MHDMKYTLITDIHIKLNNLDKVSELFDIVEEIGNPVIILGDVLDNKAIIRAECLNLVYNKLKNSKLTYKILVGNHDMLSLDVTADKNSLTTLDALPNVEIISKPIRDSQIAFIPYIHNPEILKDTIKSLINESANSNNLGEACKTIFTHADIQGFKHGSKISESGVENTDFPKDIKVISGHYHSVQYKGNITYLGSPFSHTFSEANESKYIGILDIQTLELELIKTDFPQHRSFDLLCSSTIEENHKNIEKCLTETKKDDIIRIILKGSLESINKVDRAKFPDIKFVASPDETQVEGSLVVSEIDSNEKQFEKWAKEVKKMNQETVKLGLEILEGVK